METSESSLWTRRTAARCTRGSIRAGAHTQFANSLNILAVAVDPRAPTTLYAALVLGELSKSTDAGRTWMPLPNAPTIWSIAIDPINTANLYAGGTRAIFKSTDGALTWKWTGTELAGLPIAIDPNEPRTVYAGGFCSSEAETAERDKNSSCVFKTTDAGATWIRLARLSSDLVAALVPDARNPMTLYAGTSGGLFRSTDAGRSWLLYGLGTANVRTVVADVTVPNTLYAGARGAGVFKTLDGGTTWHEASDGLTQRDVLCVSVDPHHPGTVYSGTTGGIFKSSDAGEHWTLVHESAPVYAVVTDPQQANTVYAAAGNGVLKSTDAGGQDGTARVCFFACAAYRWPTLCRHVSWCLHKQRWRGHLESIKCGNPEGEGLCVGFGP